MFKPSSYHLDNFKRNSAYCLPASLRPTLVQRLDWVIYMLTLVLTCLAIQGLYLMVRACYCQMHGLLTLL